MLHELQATAAREAFWQSSSQCAEKALDEVNTQVWWVSRHTLCMLSFPSVSFHRDVMQAGCGDTQLSVTEQAPNQVLSKPEFDTV